MEMTNTILESDVLTGEIVTEAEATAKDTDVAPKAFVLPVIQESKMELKITEENFEDVSAELTNAILDGMCQLDQIEELLPQYLEQYSGRVYTGDNARKAMKETKSSIDNGFLKPMKSRKKPVKDAYSALEKFYTGRIDRAISQAEALSNALKDGIKASEDADRAENAKKIREHWEKLILAGFSEDPFCEGLYQLVYDKAWEGLSVSQSKWKKALEGAIKDYTEGVEILGAMNAPEDIYDEALAYFRNTLNRKEAMALINQRVQEKANAEAEQKRLEEEAELRVRAKMELDAEKIEGMKHEMRGNADSVLAETPILSVPEIPQEISEEEVPVFDMPVMPDLLDGISLEEEGSGDKFALTFNTKDRENVLAALDAAGIEYFENMF